MLGRTTLDIDDPVRTLYSHDRDFRKFQSLDVRDPCSGLVFRRKLPQYATHMNQAMLIEVLRRYDTALRENGATGLFIFGSRAVGRQRPLDLFIDYDPDTKIPNTFRLMQIEEEISEALGIPVTITTRNALHPLMRESIERDAIRVS